MSERKCLKYGVPIIWRNKETITMIVCIVNFKCINRNNTQEWSYPDLDLARRTVPLSVIIPLPTINSLPTLPEDDKETLTSDKVQYVCDFGVDLGSPQRFNEPELNDLARDLNQGGF